MRNCWFISYENYCLQGGDDENILVPVWRNEQKFTKSVSRNDSNGAKTTLSQRIEWNFPAGNNVLVHFRIWLTNWEREKRKQGAREIVKFRGEGRVWLGLIGSGEDWHLHNDALEVRETMPAIKGARITMSRVQLPSYPISARSPLLGWASLINLFDGHVHLTAADVTIPQPQSIKKLLRAIPTQFPTLFPLTSMCGCSDGLGLFVIRRRGNSLCTLQHKNQIKSSLSITWRVTCNGLGSNFAV
jgi:hypothetical protein